MKGGKEEKTQRKKEKKKERKEKMKRRKKERKKTQRRKERERETQSKRRKQTHSTQTHTHTHANTHSHARTHARGGEEREQQREGARELQLRGEEGRWRAGSARGRMEKRAMASEREQQRATTLRSHYPTLKSKQSSSIVVNARNKKNHEIELPIHLGQKIAYAPVQAKHQSRQPYVYVSPDA